MKIVGHRGSPDIAPEDTISSVVKAYELGADAVEIDIHVTKDNKLIVIHDDSLLRTGKHDIKVADCTYEELKNYEVGSWFNESFTGEKLPLLSDVIAVVPSEKILIIEIKRDLDPMLLIDELRQSGKPMSSFIIISFGLKVLKSIKRIESGLLVLWIPPELSETVSKLPALDDLRKFMEDGMVDGLAFDSRLDVSDEELEAIRAFGLKILCSWTVDTLDKAVALSKLKVDFIETNYLQLIKQGSYG